MADDIFVAVALDGTGWHPASWREDAARPDQLFTGRYWVDLARQAERGGVDVLTLEDTFSLRPGRFSAPSPRTDRVSGRLDSVLLANRIAPATARIGVIPTAIVTHTEPFHTSKAIATLDHVSPGRAGVRVQVSSRPHEAALFGRRSFPDLGAPTLDAEAVVRGDPATVATVRDLFAEAADYVEVLRRLWDSWEDDAEIRDADTDRFVDRDRLHYIDFDGEWFSVRGPSITPRSPQGQPIVAALGHHSVPYELIGGSADVGFVTPTGTQDAARIVDEIDTARRAAGRAEPVRVLVDLLVVIDRTTDAARARLDRLDERSGSPLSSDAQIVAGTASEVADAIGALTDVAGVDGVRLRPAVLPDDLIAVTDELIPELRARERVSDRGSAATLRDRLGLVRPESRYARDRSEVSA